MTNAPNLDPNVKKVINSVHTYWGTVTKKEGTCTIRKIGTDFRTKVIVL
jgi:hypothetical protein